MHGFAKDLDLSHLISGELTSVSIDQNNIYFAFVPDNHICISGEWKVIDDKNSLVDGGILGEDKDAYKIHKLLGKKIKDYKINSPKSLFIIFNNNWILEIIDNSDHYESCSISPNIYI